MLHFVDFITTSADLERERERVIPKHFALRPTFGTEGEKRRKILNLKCVCELLTWTQKVYS